MSRKIAVTSVTDVPSGMVLLPEKEVENLRGIAAEYEGAVRARLETEGKILRTGHSQPSPVTEPVTDNPCEDAQWYEAQIDRLHKEIQHLKARIPPLDAEPVASLVAGFYRLDKGQRWQFAEWFSFLPELKQAIACRHGHIPKYLHDL